MNYPIWELTTIGGGSLIAFISVVHVYVSHLAVGGGIFIWLTDRKGVKDKNADLVNYVRKHTWFFLLLTMVFGGVTGVGIWFIIALVNPAGTSALIHLFVFAWATEWVFFVGEILALLIYHYKFEQLPEKARLNLAFLYALFAWLSLFVINGILSFMLTPGQWLESGGFFQGFFNPTFISSTFFRTFMSLIIAGLFAYVTAVYLKKEEFRNTVMRYSSKWLLYALPLLIFSGFWYYFSIPEVIRHTNFNLNPQSAIFINLFIILSVVLFVGALLLSFKMKQSLQRLVAFGLVLLGLVWMGGFEYSREIARKPYVIQDYMYSNSVLKADIEVLNKSGFLAHAKWTTIKEVTTENRLEAGRELFNLQCLSCHTINGIRNDIVPLTQIYTKLGIQSLLTGQGRVHDYMPPFLGTEIEKEALASYIAETLLKKNPAVSAQQQKISQITHEVPPFDTRKAEYVLLAWNDLGMHCVSDSDPDFVILPPANTLEAQLIKRGETPELVNEGVIITYQVEPGYENPSKHVDFWKYAESNFGKKLEENIGLFGNGLSGTFHFDEDRNGYIVEAIPVVPYKDDNTYNPYPLFTIEVKDAESGKVLATTKVVAPTSTEMRCMLCHEGGWRVNNLAGIDPITSTNILAVHDRYEETDLLKQAQNGKPQLCQSCHADAALGAPGKPDVLNFSTAMHGWHANYMPNDDARACVMCHPAAKQGNTQCSRGFHNTLDLTCVDCHGNMQEHALALLKAESAKEAASDLMKNLKTVHVETVDEVNPRLPWVKEPDCLTCHEDFEKPAENPNAFNVWNDEFSELYRMRTGNGGVRCEACHGSTHALYPAKNPYGKDRDNIQPMQYSGKPYPIGANFECAVCHIQKMEDSIHHENMEHMFRNMNLVK